MKAVPRTTASTVRARRSLWAAMLRSDTLVMVLLRGDATLRLDPRHHMKDRLHGGVVEFVDDLTVPQKDDPVSEGRGASIMGHDDHRLVVPVHSGAQNVENLLARVGVQVAGGFVAEDYLRPAHEGTRAGHALLLASRQLTGAVREPFRQAQAAGDLDEPLLVHLFARDVRGQGDVLRRSQGGNKVERLKDEAQTVAAECRELFVPEIGQVGISNVGGTGSERVKPRHRVHEGGLAGAGRPHNRSEFIGGEVDGNTVESDHPCRALTVGFDNFYGPCGRRPFLRLIQGMGAHILVLPRVVGNFVLIHATRGLKHDRGGQAQKKRSAPVVGLVRFVV